MSVVGSPRPPHHGSVGLATYSVRTRSSLAALAIPILVRRGRAELGFGVFGARPASGAQFVRK